MGGLQSYQLWCYMQVPCEKKRLCCCHNGFTEMEIILCFHNDKIQLTQADWNDAMNYSM